MTECQSASLRTIIDATQPRYAVDDDVAGADGGAGIAADAVTAFWPVYYFFFV